MNKSKLDTKRYNELNSFVEEIGNIEIMAKESFEYCHYLHFPKSEKEKDYLVYSEHFRDFSHILWRNAVIEIAKLLSAGSTDKYCLKKLIKKFTKDGEYSKAGINEDIVNNWLNFFEEHKLILKKVRDVRDLIYAHTDSPENRKRVEGITFDEFKKLFAFIDVVIKGINEMVFDKEVERRIGFDRRQFDIIEVLAAEKEKRIAEILGPGFKINK